MRLLRSNRMMLFLLVSPRCLSQHERVNAEQVDGLVQSDESMPDSMGAPGVQVLAYKSEKERAEKLREADPLPSFSFPNFSSGV